MAEWRWLLLQWTCAGRAAGAGRTAHPYRNDYARDRDRVIHSRAFRRLEAKTQVFTTRYSDHFRNRLTHTIEVAQIARTVARALELNTDLAEALALVHDIGHPPFGHAGERRLDELLKPLRRTASNTTCTRCASSSSSSTRYLDFPGLNLTFEVREGIVKHSRDYTRRRRRGGISASSRNTSSICARPWRRRSWTPWMRSPTTSPIWTTGSRPGCSISTLLREELRRVAEIL
jgi:predicted deoxyguanosinetriphosphate triphosphohydrolase